MEVLTVVLQPLDIEVREGFGKKHRNQTVIYCLG